MGYLRGTGPNYRASIPSVYHFVLDMSMNVPEADSVLMSNFGSRPEYVSADAKLEKTLRSTPENKMPHQNSIVMISRKANLGSYK
jgi:hypothetical protein